MPVWRASARFVITIDGTVNFRTCTDKYLHRTAGHLLDVFQGLKPDGKILINTTRTREELKIKPPNKMVTVDATGIALKRGLGSETAPIVNTAIIGAFVKMFPKISIGSLLESVKAAAPAKKEDNAAAAKDAYEITEEV